MASVPGGHDSTAGVRAFYEQSGAVVALAQVVELGATIPLVVFVLGLGRSRWVDDPSKSLLVAGGGVAVAAILTTVPPLWLCVVGPTGPSSLVRNLALLSDLVDVLLFLTIASFATACWRVWRGPSWAGWTSLVVAALCALRAVEIISGGTVLEVVAPVSFLVLVATLSGYMVRRPTPGGRAARQEGTRVA